MQASINQIVINNDECTTLQNIAMYAPFYLYILFEYPLFYNVAHEINLFQCPYLMLALI